MNRMPTLRVCLICMLGCFYFTLGNMHPRYRSKFQSIQLVALVKNEYIKKYSMNTVLRPIVDDLKRLVSLVNRPLLHKLKYVWLTILLL